MTILLDHCVPRRYQRLLQSWGYSVTLTTEHIQADAADMQVILLAHRLDAVLVTVDTDFSNILDYPPQRYGGIMVLRYQPIDEAQLDASLRQALIDLYREGLRNVLVIVTPTRYRIRRGEGL